MASSGVATDDLSNFEAKKEFIVDRLQKRDDERIAKEEKNKEERLAKKSDAENTSFFGKIFSTSRNDLENELSASESLGKNKLSDHFDKLSKMHQYLQKFLSDSTMFLPAYDIQHAQDILANLSTKIQEKRDELIPKKKFAFKSKKKQTAEKPVEAKPEVKTDVKDDEVVLADCKFTDRSSETLVMKEEINQKDVALARLEGCTIQLYGAPSAVHINKLTNCKVFCGPVSGSIFIRECVDCVFVVPCQQLRIHTTKNTKFYIHVTSRAIIEDTNSVQFGPYNWAYPSIDEHYKVSGLDKSRNSWNDIDDFNWLAADKHSPNWSLLPESDQNPTWD